MRQKQITNDLEKSQLLINVLTETQNPASVMPPFPQDVQLDLESMAATFRQAALGLQAGREAFKLANVRFRGLEEELRVMIRHALHAVKRKVRTANLSTATVEAFGLYVDTTQPRSLRYIKTPEEVAMRILQANTQALSQGVAVLVDPSPQDFQVLLAQLREAREARQLALAQERAAFETMKLARADVDVLIGQIKGYVRMRFAGRDAISLRNAMRSFGFSYVPNRPGETQSDVSEDVDATGREGELIAS